MLTAAACAQALWALVSQRSEVTRCLRKDGRRGSSLQQSWLSAAQLLLALLLQGSHGTAAAATSTGPFNGRGSSPVQQAEQPHLAQTEQLQEEQSQRRLSCLQAWICCRSVQFLGAAFRCCCLLTAASNRRSGRISVATQGAGSNPSPPQSRVEVSQLEGWADIMSGFARRLIDVVACSSSGAEAQRAARSTRENFKQRAPHERQEDDGPLVYLRGRAALRSCSFLLGVLWKSHEFVPLQRQQQALLLILVRLLHTLPRLRHRRMLEDALDAVYRTGALAANRGSSSRRMLLFLAAEVLSVRQQQLQGTVGASAGGASQRACVGTDSVEQRRLLCSSLLSLAFELMAGAAAAEEGGEMVAEVSCHLRDVPRAALQSAYDEFCEHHLYKGNA
ncbi:hypothetical protein cyc_01033 [Cyclospora cayetanensis]|uniref:Uncharacterized protein n=1 Tax=Cyclospora cayetanensis TaxID=88456 RepID=A0A1D3DAN3_9EIME|nr:hypothetical protein cyc_01033 [Cyclospora cayetanensis]